MMEESDHDVRQIASQLEEAALTNVTEAHNMNHILFTTSLPSENLNPPIQFQSSATDISNRQMNPQPNLIMSQTYFQPISTIPITTSASGYQQNNTNSAPPISGFVPSSCAISQSLPTNPTNKQTSPPPVTFIPKEVENTQFQYSPPSQQNLQTNLPYNPGQTTSPQSMQSPFQASQSIDFSALPDDGYIPDSRNQEGIFGWLSSNSFMHKVVEKAKTASESVITTLDPGMKQVLSNSGDLTIMVPSMDSKFIETIRQAFQHEFNKVNVIGCIAQASSARQIIGQLAALKSIDKKVECLQKLQNQNSVFVASESFISELVPDKWFDLNAIRIIDPVKQIELTTFTQSIPIRSEDVMKAHDMTPPNYEFKWSGLSVTLQDVLIGNTQLTEYDWRKDVFGFGFYESIFNAAKALASIYKKQLSFNI